MIGIPRPAPDSDDTALYAAFANRVARDNIGDLLRAERIRRKAESHAARTGNNSKARETAPARPATR
jgi:hypothetical protein